MDCMPSGLVASVPISVQRCPTPYSLLRSLAAFNAWAAFLTIILGEFCTCGLAHIGLIRFTTGHDQIRSRVPSCTGGQEWRPWSSIFFACIHPLLMVVSTFTIQLNGFSPDWLLIYAIWTMRPRFVITPMLFLLGWLFDWGNDENPYLWTFKDNVVEETLLNIFSLPFALLFISNRSNAAGQAACQDSAAYTNFWNAFYVIAATGVLSLMLLFMMVIHGCRTCHGRGDRDGKGLSSFWAWALVLGGLNMVVALVGQWVLWGS